MQEANQKQPLLIGRKDAAKLLSVSPRTVDNLIRTKALRFRRIGKRVLIPLAHLEAFAKRGA